MVIFIPQNIWEKQLIRFRVEISAATKLTVLSESSACAAGRANNIELSMLVSDFMVKCRLKNTRWNFCGIYGMS